MCKMFWLTFREVVVLLTIMSVKSSFSFEQEYDLRSGGGVGNLQNHHHKKHLHHSHKHKRLQHHGSAKGHQNDNNWSSKSRFSRNSDPSAEASTKSNFIFWNTSNPIFRIDNTDHIIDVKLNTAITIVCPHYARNVSRPEQFIVYAVNKEEYDTCRIMSANPHKVAVCKRPYDPVIFSMSFRSFSPMPGSLQFQAGKDYYFMSTSSHGDLHRRWDGMCRSNNMRVVFKVYDGRFPPTTTPAPTTTAAPPPPDSYFKNSVHENNYPSPGFFDFDSNEVDENKGQRRRSKNVLNSEGNYDKKKLSLDYFSSQFRNDDNKNNREDQERKLVLKQEASRTSGAEKGFKKLPALALSAIIWVSTNYQFYQ